MPWPPTPPPIQPPCSCNSGEENGKPPRFRLLCTFRGGYSSSPYVKVFTLGFGCVLLLCLTAAGRDLGEVLKGVEARYNRAGTLSMRFEQKYLQGGRAQRAESGLLSLRKPGRMRWQYEQPSGKVFVSDGKFVWFYSPAENRAERSKLKAADDFRAPLAFLLGKLDFKRDFGQFEFKETGGEAHIVALPKTDRTPYTRVEFTVTPQNMIRRLVVQGSNATVMEFLFTGELLNPALSDSLFRYTPPAGAEVVEVEQ